MQHIIINLQAALMSFGMVKVDRLGTTNLFPTTSMLTGLLGNALGYDRREGQRLQHLQDRLVHAARVDRAQETLLREYQTAAMHRGERAWTPTGEPEERAGGEYSLQQLWQEYLQDAHITVALRLEPPGGHPSLEDLALALQASERPLFIGRKHCLPNLPPLAGYQEAASALEALRLWPIQPEGAGEVPVSWPPGDGDAATTISLQRESPEVKNWTSGTHGGTRTVMLGTIARGEFPQRAEVPGEETEE